MLLVQCVTFRAAATVCSNILCPSRLLEDVHAIDYFSDWCDQICPPQEYSHSRVFPALVELRQNLPTSLLMADCRGLDTPVIIVVALHGVREPYVLTYVATQTVSASHVVDWIRWHIDFRADYILQLNGLEIDRTQMLTFTPGSVFRLQTLEGRRLREASTTQGQVASSSSQGSQASWPGVQEHEYHEVPEEEDLHAMLQVFGRPAGFDPTRLVPTGPSEDGASLRGRAAEQLKNGKIGRELWLLRPFPRFCSSPLGQESMWPFTYICPATYMCLTIEDKWGKHATSFARLPPPGNTVRQQEFRQIIWVASDMNKMDRWLMSGETLFVLDDMPVQPVSLLQNLNSQANVSLCNLNSEPWPKKSKFLILAHW